MARVYHADLWGLRHRKYDWLCEDAVRTADWDETKTYCRIVTALKVTIEIQEEIDALYPKVEERIVEIDL